MLFEEIQKQIEDADMLLVGLGEEFNDTSFLKADPGYSEGRTEIEESGKLWLLPAYDEWYRSKEKERKGVVKDALNKLAEVLQGKNYFIVSTSVNDLIDDIPWREGRLVRPCGGSRRKQCPDCCEENLIELAEVDKDALNNYFSSTSENLDLKVCSKCGKQLILNNIFAEKYDENGYLSQWQIYTKWLQGTVNKKLVILELGVGMKFPSVIRWPFEKIAFFNQKAKIYRVNGTLYQMSEELKGKGISISKNAIDWLRGM